MSNEYKLTVALKHDDKNKIAECMSADPLLFKEMFPDAGHVSKDHATIPDGWLVYERIFARLAPVNDAVLRCKLAHTEGWDYQICFYETLDYSESLWRLGYAESDHCYNGLWTTKTIVDFGNFKLKKRKKPLPGALITESVGTGGTCFGLSESNSQPF